MNLLFTRIITVKCRYLGLLIVLLTPLLGWGQATIANYDFNSTTGSFASTTSVPATSSASGVAATVTASKAFTITGTSGIATGGSAFTANAVAGSAISMGSLGVTSTDYFQFSLGDVALPKYAAFKLYLQAYRSASGPTSLALQYSLNGGAYVPYGNSISLGTTAFNENVIDLSALTALNSPRSLTFQLVVMGSGGGVARIDNFQVQAVNTVDPVISSLTPGTVEAGSADFTLLVGGSNFTNGAVVNFNGLDLATAYNSATSLTAVVPAAAVATTGNYSVTVTNPTAGSATSVAVVLPVTPALTRWTGAANTNSWFDAANWSTRTVPNAATEEVLLDHRFVAGSYTVSIDQNTAVAIKSLTVNPGVGDSIFALVPATNAVSPAALTLGSTTAALALAIYNRGVVTNASGAAAGTNVAGIEVAGTMATAFIYNGGSYRHASSLGHRLVAENLNVLIGTEQGIFDLRLPANASSSYALSTSGRNYGTLILRNRPGAATSGYLATASTLSVQGNLIIGAGVTLNATINNDLRIAGDVRSQGTFQFKETSPVSATSQVLLAGTKVQTISGVFILNGAVGLAINNPTGVMLATPVQLGGALTLTSGTLTTTATNLLTLTAPATINGGSSTSFINGPLARQTAAGALTNLFFPTGSGAAYRPITLNATAQDATSYLVSQTEGLAPSANNLLAGTTALPTLTRVSQVRFYTITPTPAANNFSGTVTIPYGTDDQVNTPNSPGFTIGKNSGSGWQNIGNSGINVSTPAPAGGYASGTITSGTFTSFSNFALAKTDANAAVNPLPVALTSFTVRRQSTGVAINWITASEVDNAHFEVQRSLDGQVFTTVADEVGHGTTTQVSHYAARDLGAPAGLLYYRLHQVDTGGQVTSSQVVALAATEAATALVLYPNPAHDHLTVLAPAGTAVQVLDLTGRLLQAGALPPSGAVEVQALMPGSYLLRVGEQQVLRFSKQ
ncbi:T9SS type A sorting domain-containing protein [Hymenobacter sp. HMF4947]|uniref:T9SS type A sorting domain-containing protein n=1 Tax=Hymenobacter ginkgonis TaxID=2682976 RepID=A0A7K1TF70_9BACT|nr:T9SS type A sorting domain-containing protein [Hymenobacter ginkgonis]MVN77056.1 T9SS type A sorting domain-containing protein [Hymenobacter ginkgonis]